MKLPQVRALRVIATVALVCYVGSMVLGFVHMIDMADMHMSMSDCPFSQFENAACFLSVSNTMKDFQKNLKSFVGFGVLKSVFFLVSGVLVSLYIVSVLRRYLLYAQRTTERWQPIFAELFSCGILNTKVF